MHALGKIIQSLNGNFIGKNLGRTKKANDKRESYKNFFHPSPPIRIQQPPATSIISSRGRRYNTEAWINNGKPSLIPILLAIFPPAAV
jgi:hypothetical protein